MSCVACGGEGCTQCGPFHYCKKCHRSIVAAAVKDTRRALRATGKAGRSANRFIRQTITQIGG